MNFRPVEEAETLDCTRGEIYAKASVDPAVIEATKAAMNRAIHNLQNGADEVIDTGRFAFEGTDRCNNYVSEDRQKLGKKAAKTTAENNAAAAVTPDDTVTSEAA